MSNLTGTAWIQRKPSPLEPSPAVVSICPGSMRRLQYVNTAP